MIDFYRTYPQHWNIYLKEFVSLKENGPTSASDQDVPMADVCASSVKASASARGLSFIEGISKSSFVKQAYDLKGSSVKVVNFQESVIYILAPLRYATIYGCSDATIVLGVIGKIHADETKSSLQFASQALRVTNCVIVNEILTDATLLKRQKREIEELRAKLQWDKANELTYTQEQIDEVRDEWAAYVSSYMYSLELMVDMYGVR